MTGRTLKRPTRLVLDYDGTLTVNDTMALLGTLPKQPPQLSWDEIVEAYLKDYEKYQAETFPWTNYDQTEYSAWLASRKWVEQNSAQRVQDSGFFNGVTQDDIESAVCQATSNGTLQLRPHWSDLFQACLSYPLPPGMACSIEILSVNWSEFAIRTALKAGAAHNPSLLSFITNTLPIHANEIQGLSSPQGSSGHLIRTPGSDRQDIRTNIDKLEHFRSSPSSGSNNNIITNNNNNIFTVYIGDSSTDFDCLCAADLGIWVHDVREDEYETASQKVFAPLRYVPPTLRSLEGEEPDGRELFYWARDFGEVLAYVTTPADG